MNGRHDVESRWAGFEVEAVASPDERDRLFTWSGHALPVAPLLLVGVMLGPQGIGFLSMDGLAAIDPAVPVALAALGVLVGLGLPLQRAIVLQTNAGIAIEGVATGAIVAAGLWVAGLIAPEQAGGGVSLVPFIAGICAASSLTLPAAHAGRSISRGRQVLERGVLVPVAIGGLLLAWIAEGTAAGAVVLTLQGCAVAAVLAAAAWLLLRGTSAGTEQRVFVFAALLLIGGAADALSSSALLVGLVSGATWQWLGGVARERVQADAAYVQHPLVALVLVVAGARAEFSAPTIALAAVYAALRLGAHSLGARLMLRSASHLSDDLIPRVLAPGVFGVAFALNALRAAGTGIEPALSVVVVGTMLAEVVLYAAFRGGAKS